MLYDQRKHLFLLVGQIFLLSFRWFNCLAEILLIFGRNKLCPLFVNFAIGITYSYLWYGRRKEAGSRLSKEISAILLPAIFLYVGHTSKVWISARQFFRFFFFDIFLFLEAVVKAALFVVGEVGAIQVVINPSPVYLRHLRLV